MFSDDVFFDKTTSTDVLGLELNGIEGWHLIDDSHEINNTIPLMSLHQVSLCCVSTEVNLAVLTYPSND